MNVNGDINKLNASAYKVWYTNYEPVNYIPYNYKLIFTLEKWYWNPTLVYHMFNKYWHYSVFIAIIYIIVIHLLQRWMRNRKPYDLRKSLAIWNSVLAIFSIFGCFRLCEEYFYVFTKYSFQDSVCFSIDPHSPAAFWALLFTMSKIIELIDTVFIVLRKRSLIFLHWFHHATVLIYCFHAASTLTASARHFIFMNYFVHSILYTYYALSSLKIQLSRRLSMFVTTLQIAQMLIGVYITIFIAYLKYDSWKFNTSLVCQQTTNNLFLCFGIYFSFALLFINFFRNSYLKSKKKKSE